MTDHIDTAQERAKLPGLAGHTPGPWQQGQNNPDRVSKSGEYIANCNPTHQTHPRTESNARLIAACMRERCAQAMLDFDYDEAGPQLAGVILDLPLDPDAEAALQRVVNAAAQDERERIAGALDSEAELIPCAEDSAVIRRCAQLVRADFSYDAAEALEALETLKRPEAGHE